MRSLTLGITVNRFEQQLREEISEVIAGPGYDDEDGMWSLCKAMRRWALENDREALLDPRSLTLISARTPDTDPTNARLFRAVETVSGLIKEEFWSEGRWKRLAGRVDSMQHWIQGQPIPAGMFEDLRGVPREVGLLDHLRPTEMQVELRRRQGPVRERVLLPLEVASSDYDWNLREEVEE